MVNNGEIKENHDKPHQNSAGAPRTYTGSTVDTPRSRRTTFCSISRHKMGVHCDSLELIVLTWLHLRSLGTMCFAAVWKTSGTIAASMTNNSRNIENREEHIRTHQISREPSQEAPQRLHDLVEQLSIPFRDTSQAPHPRARHAEPRSIVLTLNPQRQVHARRTDLDFPVGLNPHSPTLIHVTWDLRP